jgi:D-alanine-D-alanine ligase
VNRSSSRKLRVGVIFGGRSGEHEVSLVSATSVINALDKEKYEVVPIGITQNGRWMSSPESLEVLKRKTGVEDEPERFLVPEPNRQALVSLDGQSKPGLELDVVFPVVHGTFGEDGSLQGLLELANIPYVGAGVLASAVGMDKIVQKQLHKNAGLPIVRYEWFLSAACKSQPKKVIAAIEKKLKYPLFVKPANTGSSVGISKAHNRAELSVALAAAADFDRKVIVEQGVRHAREIEVSVLGNDAPIASVPGEIVPSNEFYDCTCSRRITQAGGGDAEKDCHTSLYRAGLRRHGAGRFLRHQNFKQNLPQRNQYHSRLYLDQYVSETMGGFGHFVRGIARPPDPTCAGTA